MLYYITNIILALSPRPGMNPEAPGFCVKEKDLQPCYNTRECEPGSRCVSLGRTGENYCISRQAAEEVAEEEQILQQIAPKPSYQVQGQRGNGPLGEINCIRHS